MSPFSNTILGLDKWLKYCELMIFSNTKLGLYTWLKFCELMILGLSIRKCAEEVGVGVKTSIYMRHRILDVINLTLKNDKFQCII